MRVMIDKTYLAQLRRIMKWCPITITSGNHETSRGCTASTESNQSKTRWLNSDLAPASQCAPAPSFTVKVRLEKTLV
jgi:hypothetical protein